MPDDLPPPKRRAASESKGANTMAEKNTAVKTAKIFVTLFS